MSKFVHSLAYFLAGLPLLANRSEAATVEMLPSAPEPQDPVKLRPLNEPGSNLFAGHRSHSSHRSHASHRSGSGGYASPNPVAEPASAPVERFAPVPAPSLPTQAKPQPIVPRGSLAESGAGHPVNPGRTVVATPKPDQPQTPKMTVDEKRRLQIMRVQIALTSLGLYGGRIDGALSPQTQESLKLFQTVKELPVSGLMTTDTLNALGVPAVQ